jgi:hypothetical protein
MRRLIVSRIWQHGFAINLCSRVILTKPKGCEISTICTSWMPLSIYLSYIVLSKIVPGLRNAGSEMKNIFPRDSCSLICERNTARLLLNAAEVRTCFVEMRSWIIMRKLSKSKLASGCSQ